MFLASISVYDLLGYGLVSIIIISFASAMSKFKDNVLHKLHHVEDELRKYQSSQVK